MRRFSDGFAAHIASGATTLCWCFKIVRTDGETLGFTDHDVVLTFEGTQFDPAHGLDAGESVARTGPQTQTSEVLGVLHSDAINADDIALGRYDGARVESWRVNWRSIDQRELIRVDTIGEIVREDGLFRAELRSGQHAINVPRGRVYQHICDTRLGDGRCKVNLEVPAFRAHATVVEVIDAHSVRVSGTSGFAEGWFAFGVAQWTSGKRDGLRDGVTGSHGDVVAFEAQVGEWAAPGDTLTIHAGCDKHFATCRSKFANGVNFQGFPHIPGNDFVLRYPNAGDQLDGQVLVR